MESSECEAIRNEFQNIQAVKVRFDERYEKAIQEGSITDVHEIKKDLEEKTRRLWEKVDPDDIHTRRKLAEKWKVDYVGKKYDGIYNAKDKKGWKLINSSGTPIVEEYFKGVGDFKNGCAFCVRQDNEYVLVNKNGRIIEMGGMKLVGISENIISLREAKNGSAVFLNLNGNLIINDAPEDVGVFSEGLAPIKIEDEWYFVDKTGSIAISTNAHIEQAQSFKEGLAAIKFRGDRGWTFMDKQKKFIELNNKEYIEVKDFSEGMAAVKDKAGKWNFIDKQGNELQIYAENADSFKNGFARISLGGKWYFIRKDGKSIGDEGYKLCRNFENGVALVVKDDGRRYFINEEGKYIANTEGYYRANSFSDGLAWVINEDGDKYHFINTKGEKMFNQEFEEAADFEGGLAWVKTESEEYYINKHGRRFI
jgi:hypothetical protein